MSTSEGLLLEWDAQGLRSRLETSMESGRIGAAPAVSVRVVAHTGSTNTDLLAEPASGGAWSADRLHVLLAERQTAGRGRQGRSWRSAPGASLTFSIGLCLRPVHGWGALSLVVGHAVAQVLQPWPSTGTPADQGRLMLKWPNDLWWYADPPTTPESVAAGAKVAGILIETQPLPAAMAHTVSTAATADTDGSYPAAWTSGTRWVVIGIGLNVRRSEVHDAAGVVACTADWSPKSTAVDWWHALTPAVVSAVRRFERSGLGPVLPEVERRELLLGQMVNLSSGGLRAGRAVGIDPDGALRVRARDGVVHRVVAGEVSIRPRVESAGADFDA